MEKERDTEMDEWTLSPETADGGKSRNEQDGHRRIAHI